MWFKIFQIESLLNIIRQVLGQIQVRNYTSQLTLALSVSRRTVTAAVSGCKLIDHCVKTSSWAAACF